MMMTCLEYQSMVAYFIGPFFSIFTQMTSRCGNCLISFPISIKTTFIWAFFNSWNYFSSSFFLKACHHLLPTNMSCDSNLGFVNLSKWMHAVFQIEWNLMSLHFCATIHIKLYFMYTLFRYTKPFIVFQRKIDEKVKIIKKYTM